MPSAAGDGLGRRAAAARGGWRPDPERVTATAVGNGAESRALVVSYPEPLTAAQKNHAALLDLGLFEPWFLIQGLLLLLAGRWFARTAAGHRWWILSLIAGVVLVGAFGIALAVAHKHFAVS